MDETIRIILIILISVSIFGLVVFVFVRNYIKKRLDFYLKEKNKKKWNLKEYLLFLNNLLFLNLLPFLMFQNRNQI